MEPKYYMIIDGNQAGPYPREILAMQGLTPDTFVWREGLEGWVKASALPELSSILHPHPDYGNPSAPVSPQPAQASAESAAPRPETVHPQQPAQQPYPPYNPYQHYNRQPAADPIAHTNWLPWAIIGTVVGALFSCIGLIFGIIGIVQANKANRCYAYGDKYGGDTANSSARTMTIICLVLAAIGLALNIVLFTSGGLYDIMQQAASMRSF